MLIHLRKGETFAQLGAGFEVSTSTACRYVEEAVALLSARSPKPAAALRKAKQDGLHLLVLDGTLITCDRVRADRPYYSAKHRCHGMNVQVIAGPDGTIVWTSGALPGRTHDLTAARVWGILRELEAAGIITLADKGTKAPPGCAGSDDAGADHRARGGTAGSEGVHACRPSASRRSSARASREPTLRGGRRSR